MLRRLVIRNYAIIDEVDIEFSPRLNIITGETGAGKSIMLGALGLLKGERAQTQMIRAQKDKCIIEGYFEIDEKQFKDWFLKNQIPLNKTVLIRRELGADGKTKALINDVQVGISILQDIGNQFVEIHSQHDSLEIKSSEFQLEVVDAFAGNEVLLAEMSQAFTQYKNLEKEYQLLQAAQSRSQAEKDLHTYQLQELNTYDFEEWDEEKIEQDHQLAENALEIKQQLSSAVLSMKGDEASLIDGLKDVLIRLRKFEKYSKDLLEIDERLDVSIDHLEQIVRDYESLADNTEFDEEELLALREKVDFLHKMFKKHQVDSIEQLHSIKRDLATALNFGEDIDSKLIVMEKQLDDLKMKTMQIADKLTEKRRAILPTIESQLMNYLGDLQMENSQFQIELVTDMSKMNSRGVDTVEFLFTANAGSPLRELKRAISGGEMSRFMLAIKSLIAEKIQLPTIIFDEIDTGVSGTVANKVAMALDKLSKKHQIIAITHLPQIASRGSHHFNVFKTLDNQVTTTYIKLLHQADREIEIAKMISGESITQASLTSARELLK